MTGTVAVGKAPWLLARFTQGAIAAAAVAEVFRAVAVREHGLHPTDTAEHTSGLASMVSAYLMTVTAVLFLVWFTRSRRNAEILSPGAVTGSGAWAVASWLVPVVNLWVPRGLVLEVQRVSGAAEGDNRRGDLLVNVWWAAWVGHAVLTMASQAGGGTSLPLLLVAQALDLTAGVLAVWLIQRITARQSAALGAVPAGAGLGGEGSRVVHPPAGS